MTAPLVSCVMPTYNRRRFVPLAIEYFLRQDYPSKELVVLDDGTDPVADLIPDTADVRYIRLDARMALGAKRNLACERAHGDVIIHWDDDDWSASTRVSYQVDGLLSNGADICGLRQILLFDERNGAGWRYAYPVDGRPWVAGGTLCYTREHWRRTMFPAIRLGEDTRFVWKSSNAKIHALDDETFYVALMHRASTSPKRTSGTRWTKLPGSEVVDVLGSDAATYGAEPTVRGATRHDRRANGRVVPAGDVVTTPAANGAPARRNEPDTPVAPIRNLYACLVHEQPTVIADLVRNLRHLDPDSDILLYDGSADSTLLDRCGDLERLGAAVHPSPRPMRWGKLHGFAIDAMEFGQAEIGFDTLTIVDSDQLALRPGYSEFLGRFLHGKDGIGILGKEPAPQTNRSREGPARAALAEAALWKPYLDTLPGGSSGFPHWTFWPSTVFTAPAAHDLVERFRTDTALQDIIDRSRIWATEEVILPTMTVALGHRYVANPCSYDLVRYRTKYSTRHLDAAAGRDDIHWAHPVPRVYTDPLRRHVRRRHHDYTTGKATAMSTDTRHDIFTTRGVLNRMRPIAGWLADDEAELLLGGAFAALRDCPGGQIVEIGSYCGRSTVVIASAIAAVGADIRVSAIDPHDGRVGSSDGVILETGRTLAKFKRTIKDTGLTDHVDAIQGTSTDVDWDRDIGLLFIDGLHDYESVWRDFTHFDPWVVAGGYVAFHDYADYFPGVMAVVDGLIADGRYALLERAGSMVLLRKRQRPANGDGSDQTPITGT